MEAKKHETVFVPIKEGTTRLDADPENKKKRFQKLTEGPARKTGLVILLLIAIVTTLYSRNKLESGPHSSGSPTVPDKTAALVDSARVITHGWSATIYRDTTKSTRFTSDPLSVIMEVRNPNNPKRVVRWDDNGHIPPGWSQLQFRLADDEQLMSAKLTIR